jgi:hypothetical protein
MSPASPRITFHLTRAALAALDTHTATDPTPAIADAWLDTCDALEAAVADAFVADTTGINRADEARAAVARPGGRAWLRSLISCEGLAA